MLAVASIRGSDAGTPAGRTRESPDNKTPRGRRPPLACQVAAPGRAGSGAVCPLVVTGRADTPAAHCAPELTSGAAR